MIHREYSYVHHPELINLNEKEAVFKVIETTIPKEYDSLEKAITLTNELNRDFELDEPTVTKEGILKDNMPECKALLNRIGVEIDLHLDTLEYLDGIELSYRNYKNKDFKRIFDETSKRIYRFITGKQFPEL